MDANQATALRYAESMKLFEKDGLIHYGTWSRWQHASSKNEADAILREFRAAEHPLPD